MKITIRNTYHSTHVTDPLVNGTEPASDTNFTVQDTDFIFRGVYPPVQGIYIQLQDGTSQ